MSEKLEQVARALCRQYEIDDGFSPEQADRAAAGEMYRNFLNAARTAIAALREPTSYMIAGAASKPGQQSYGDVWRAMIDEALK